MKKNQPIESSGCRSEIWASVAAIGLALGLSFLTGCAHSSRGEDPVATRGLFREQIPWLLTGPTALLLTNADGYRANVQVTKSTAASEDAPEFSGELFCRQSQLLWVPADRITRDHPAAKSGFSFIWDVAQQRGFALCESLQGYAPISSSRPNDFRLEVKTDTAAVSKAVDAQPCVAEPVTVIAGDGAVNHFENWRATNLKNIPLKIISLDGTSPFTVSLTQTSLTVPPPEEFVPPAGFTAYASFEAMLAELAEREQSLRPPAATVEHFDRSQPGSDRHPLEGGY